MDDNSFLLVANHIIDPSKFFIRHFTNEAHAVMFMEYKIEKDIYGN